MKIVRATIIPGAFFIEAGNNGTMLCENENELRELRNAITNALQDHTEVTSEYILAVATPLDNEAKHSLIVELIRQLAKGN